MDHPVLTITFVPKMMGNKCMVLLEILRKFHGLLCHGVFYNLDYRRLKLNSKSVGVADFVSFSRDFSFNILLKWPANLWIALCMKTHYVFPDEKVACSPLLLSLGEAAGPKSNWKPSSVKLNKFVYWFFYKKYTDKIWKIR